VKLKHERAEIDSYFFLAGKDLLPHLDREVLVVHMCTYTVSSKFLWSITWLPFIIASSD
jgi:hypothetical protein